MNLPHARHLDVYAASHEFFTRHPASGDTVWRAESFAATAHLPTTVRRALALNSVLENATLAHVPGELLVGAGYAGLRVPSGTFAPERLASAKASLAVLGERSFAAHASHHSLDYRTILGSGLAGLEERTRAVLAAVGAGIDREFLESVVLAVGGARRHLRRWSLHLAELSHSETRYAELLQFQARQLRRLADESPRTFWDALQLTYLCHCMMQLDLRHAQAFGRLDQYLFPFYQADLASDRITAAAAQDLFDHLFAKITAPDDFVGLANVQNITLGGVRPEDGGNAANDLSDMILEACRRVGKPGGNCTARIGRATPAAFVEKCAEVIQSGIGYPALFNDDLEIESLLAIGYPVEHARDYCFVGCIEVQIQGRHAPWADDRINPLHAVNLALFDGVDSLTGAVCDAPSPGEPTDFEAFYQRFLHHARRQIRSAIDRADGLQRAYNDHRADFTAPLLSAFTADCIERGRDVNDGGAVYPGDYGFGCMGIASVADSLMAVKAGVFDRGIFTLEQLRDLCRRNFDGCEAERQRLLRGIPKFGNDHDDVDALAARVVEDLAAEFRSRRTPSGGRYLMLMAANTQNVWAGAQIGATPDGRLAGTPVSDASSPAFGRDLQGPTAVIHSVGKLPYHLCPAGNVVNLKLEAASHSDEGWRRALAALITGAMRMGVSELQFNTTGAEALRDAMAHPEEHGGLVVRVSGFSATFVTQPRAVQEDILARTEHRLGR